MKIGKKESFCKKKEFGHSKSLTFFERGYIVIYDDFMEVSFKEISSLKRFLEGYEVEKLVWGKRLWFFNFNVRIYLKDYDKKKWLGYTFLNNGPNAYYFSKRREVINFKDFGIRDTSDLKIVWRVIDIPTDLKCRILYLKSCVIFHYKEGLKIKFRRFDSELAILYALKKFENSSYGWCLISEFNLITSEGGLDLMGLEEIELIKKVSFVDEEFMEIEIKSSCLENHIELYNIFVVCEDKFTWDDKLYNEIIKN